MYSCGPPLMDVQEWDDQHELTYSSYVRTRVVILKTCRRRWMIGRNGERRSGISAQAARHDDDDDYSTLSSLLEFELRSPFNKFPCFFVLAFKISVDSWKFSMILLYILWDDWPIFTISGSREQLQQELEYTQLKPDCHSWWIS